MQLSDVEEFTAHLFAWYINARFTQIFNELLRPPLELKTKIIQWEMTLFQFVMQNLFFSVLRLSR